MALYSDINGFPESGFPVLADMEDRFTLNTLYYNPLKHLGYKIDVVGNVRFLGALVLGGSLTGVTSIAMAGALTGATTIDASGQVTLSGGNLVMTTGNILMTSGEIGSLLAHIKKAWFKDLHIENRPSCGPEDEVALVSDLQRIWKYIPNTSVQALTGTTPSWDANSGINATLTISGNTTITLSNLVAGTSGNLSIINPITLYTLTVSGYTNKISSVAYLAANQLKVSGSSKLDIFSWYYDGTYLWWNGGQNYV
jgi:hypothetical protein